MKRTKAFWALAVVLILAAALLVAAPPAIPTNVLPESLQIPPGAESLLGQWLSPAESLAVVAAFLELTPEQVSSLTTLLQQRHTAIAPLIQEIVTRQQQIAEQLQSGAPDALTIGTLVIEIHQYLQQVHGVQATFMQDFLNLLNEEQRHRYAALGLAEQWPRSVPPSPPRRLFYFPPGRFLWRGPPRSLGTAARFLSRGPVA